MNLYQQIKADQLESRKQRDSRDELRIALLTTLLGDAAMIAKNDAANPGREPTDSEMTALLKKYVKNNLEFPEGARRVTHDAELHVLEYWLPKQLDESQLLEIIQDIVTGQPGANMGNIMRALKQTYDGQYDGALASRLIKEQLA